MNSATLRPADTTGKLPVRLAGSAATVGTLALGAYHLSGNLQIAAAALLCGVAAVALLEWRMHQRAQRREAVVIKDDRTCAIPEP